MTRSPAAGRHHRRIAAATAGISLALALAGCATAPPPAPYERQTEVDFSGAWELDYERSDNVNRELDTLLLRLSRPVSGYGGNDPGYGGWSGGSLETVVALARLADEITRSPVLKIAQTADEIAVEREETFDLTCVFPEASPWYEEGPLASELCGWADRQLVFRSTLPDGLTIDHRFTLAPDGEQLHVATTLTAPGAGRPFTLSRFYRRFEPLPDRFTCEDTLTRGRVCRRASR